MSGCPFDLSRRKFFGAAAGVAASGAILLDAHAGTPTPEPTPRPALEPFWGPHQGGIATPAQAHSTFAAFDLRTAKREDVAALLRAWTEAAARMSAGQPVAPLGGADADGPAGDTGDVLELPPARLTITFGFGPALFTKDGADRYGLARLRPAALIDLPRFTGDQLVPERTGGDLSVQACADDPQVAFHAVRQLARIAYDTAQIRWTQSGFLPGFAPGETPRNLMGFKDGTRNVPVADKTAMAQFVWVDDDSWMQGGSYVVARPIRIALEHWDRMKLAFQEQTVGRQKLSGAPLGGTHESDGLNLDAVDADDNPVVPENSHARLAAPESNEGAQILRRPYSYDNGVNFTAERWPPWRQAMEFDAGLFFLCYQRDPRAGFVKIFDRMSKFDMLNQFVTHVGGGLFACPGGATEGEYIGQRLFEAV